MKVTKECQKYHVGLIPTPSPCSCVVYQQSYRGIWNFVKRAGEQEHASMLNTVFPQAVSRNIPWSFIISIGANIGCGSLDEKCYLANSHNIISYYLILDFAENFCSYHGSHIQLLNTNVRMSNF